MYIRIVEKRLLSLLETPEILVLYGPRRVGKTTLLRKLHAQIQPSHPTIFYTLDDPTAQAIFGEPATARLERIFAELGFVPERRAFLFLDEIQSFPQIDLLPKSTSKSFGTLSCVGAAVLDSSSFAPCACRKAQKEPLHWPAFSVASLPCYPRHPIVKRLSTGDESCTSASHCLSIWSRICTRFSMP